MSARSTAASLASPDRFFTASLAEADPAIAAAIGESCSASRSRSS